MIRYVVAPSSVRLAGTRLAQAGRLSLYRIQPPLRLATLLGGVYADGWMGADAALTQYATPSRSGRLRVRVSRRGWGGPSPSGQVTIRVGPLTAKAGQPAIGAVTASRTFTVRSGGGRIFTLTTPRVPYRLEIHVGSTFSPTQFGQTDTRQLGAQVQVTIVPSAAK
jgi:hypothetical protein